LRRQHDVDHLLAAAVDEDSLVTLPRLARDSPAHHWPRYAARSRARTHPAIGAAKEFVEAAAKIVLVHAGVQAHRAHASASCVVKRRQPLTATTPGPRERAE
jgi:hypothetical protein